MAEGDEVGVLEETVDDSEHHRLAADPWKPLNKVQSNVYPNYARDLQRVQQTGRMEMLCLVSLADRTPLDVLAHKAGRSGIEGGPEALQGLLDAFMARAVRRGEELGPNADAVVTKMHRSWRTNPSTMDQAADASPCAIFSLAVMMSARCFAS